MYPFPFLSNNRNAFLTSKKKYTKRERYNKLNYTRLLYGEIFIAIIRTYQD